MSKSGNGHREVRRNGHTANGDAVAVTDKLRMAVGHRWAFLADYIRHPTRVGAIAPSSQALAEAICEPFRRSKKPVAVLEVGAGTGSVTRHIGTLLGNKDKFDICEISSELADILDRDILSNPPFAKGVAEGRVRLLRVPAQKIPYEKQYDFIICGLPLTSFQLADVQEVFAFVRRALKPHGVLSYYEYAGFRRTSRALSVGRRRDRIREVHAYLTRNIKEHQFAMKTVFQNLPPAHARHLRFD